jgi:hypothetical protein
MESEVILQSLEDDMPAKPIENVEPFEDRNALLEKALVEEYLHQQGYSLKDFKNLPAELANKLMKEALRYASLKLEEVEARAHFIKGLQDDSSSLEK